MTDDNHDNLTETGHRDQVAEVGGSTADLTAMLTGWLPSQRWFSGKGQQLGAVQITARHPLATVLGGAEIEQVLVTVPTPTGPLNYQVWVGWHRWLPDKLQHARIGSSGEWTAYDALHDVAVGAFLLTSLAEGAERGGLTFAAEPDAEIDTDAPGLVIGAEQSNTSIVFGNSAILKMFRRLEPGTNPDAEVHRALHAAGSTHIAAPLGVISGPVDGVETTLGLLTAFFANSAEGWAMATASVRDLIAEGDLRADEVGGDFANEAKRLGRAVAEVHADLAAAFGTSQVDEAGAREAMAQMVATAEATAAQVPSVAENLDGIRAAFARAGAQPGGFLTQRIHGDLHLGQTLRTLQGWVVIDFEGEPSKPLSYRRALHSPLRDIAGMLRSFDYAAHHSLAGGQADSQQLYRATEWAGRNRAAFCEGYAVVSGVDPRAHGALLAAYELDKAVYEVAYEHGHRPTWEPIPLQAVIRLIKPGGKT